MKGAFRLAQGVDASGTEKLRSSYSVNISGVKALLSGELILPAAKKLTELLEEPVFFFLELPQENSEEYDIYYLDNCTKQVAAAILDRYGELLAQDGVSRFGFGSHKTEEELYFGEYQELSVYAPGNSVYEEALEELGLEGLSEADSIWELLSDEEPGTLTAVEIEGETVFDLPELLKNAGIYKAE